MTTAMAMPNQSDGRIRIGVDAVLLPTETITTQRVRIYVREVHSGLQPCSTDMQELKAKAHVHSGLCLLHPKSRFLAFERIHNLKPISKDCFRVALLASGTEREVHGLDSRSQYQKVALRTCRHGGADLSVAASDLDQRRPRPVLHKSSCNRS